MAASNLAAAGSGRYRHGSRIMNADRADFILGDMAGAADHRQQPARLGRLLATERQGGPDGILDRHMLARRAPRQKVPPRRAAGRPRRVRHRSVPRARNVRRDAGEQALQQPIVGTMELKGESGTTNGGPLSPRGAHPPPLRPQTTSANGSDASFHQPFIVAGENSPQTEGGRAQGRGDARVGTTTVRCGRRRGW